MVSTPRASSAPATIMASMPTRASVPLLMSMASTQPVAITLSTCSNTRSSEMPLGGSISTESANSRCLQLAPEPAFRLALARRGSAAALAAHAALARARSCWLRAGRRSSPLPPSRECAPASCRSIHPRCARPALPPRAQTARNIPAKSADRRCGRPRACGNPALGMAESGLPAFAELLPESAAGTAGPACNSRRSPAHSWRPGARPLPPRACRRSSRLLRKMSVAPRSGSAENERIASIAGSSTFEVRKRLQNEEIHAALFQRQRLLAVNRREFPPRGSSRMPGPMPSGPIEPAMSTSCAAASRASRAIFTPR